MKNFFIDDHFLIFTLFFLLLCATLFFHDLSATYTRRSGVVCMDEASIDTAAEARHRSVDVVHDDHADTVSLCVLHEQTAAEYYGATARLAGRQQLDEA